MRSLFILLVLSTCTGFAQGGYDSTLQLKVAQIRSLEFYDNKIVYAIDTVDYNDLDFPYWKSGNTYYQDDMARFRYCTYAALKDTQGERPDTARQAWQLECGPHPFLFLRDTARQEDLRRLLADHHPFVRAYAFGALSFRGHGDLYEAILDNMKDTTSFREISGDVERNAYVAELMITYAYGVMSKTQRKELKRLIATRYRHLDTSRLRSYF